MDSVWIGCGSSHTKEEEVAVLGRNHLLGLLLLDKKSEARTTFASGRSSSASPHQPQQRDNDAGRTTEAAFTDYPGHSRALQQPGDDNDDVARQALRELLLATYDRATFPFETLWNNDNSTTATTPRSGLPVEVGLNFHRVFSVTVTTSEADLIVWVRQRWKDPRLVWDPLEHQNITTLHFWIGDGSGAAGETSEVWTPDLELWNLQSGMADTLVDAHAVVSSDGTVYWSRPGHLKPVCKFQGLENFPFDTLDCTMEIGSWAYSGLYLRPVRMDQGYSIGGSDTAGESFAEFSLVSVEVEEHVYPPYPINLEEDWPVIKYHVTFKRAWQPYARGFVVLQIVLVLASFCVFWLPPHVGERMSLAITSLLASVASELVIASTLPAAGEVTWFTKFSAMSLMFSALALFESAAVIYFYYFTGI